MNVADATRVLAKCAAFDNREVTESASLAWSEALVGVTLPEALEAVSRHYANSREWVMPGDVGRIARQVRAAKRETEQALIDADSSRVNHCGTRGCRCTHRGCVRGWIDTDTTTKPCRTCREDLTARVNSVPPPGQRDHHDQAVMRGEKRLGDA